MDRARALAARAVDAGASEAEAATAARLLAKLVHEHPEVIASEPAPRLNPTASDPQLDALVGAAVRETVAAGTDLFRDFLASYAERERARVRAVACIRCGAPSRPSKRVGRATFMLCDRGHTWIPGPAARPKPKTARAKKG